MVPAGGGMCGCSRGQTCVVAWGVCGCSGGGMRGCFGGVCLVAARGACVVAPRGACMVAPVGHVWDTMRYGDTINERAVPSYWNAFLFWLIGWSFSDKPWEYIPKYFINRKV